MADHPAPSKHTPMKHIPVSMLANDYIVKGMEVSSSAGILGRITDITEATEDSWDPVISFMWSTKIALTARKSEYTGIYLTDDQARQLRSAIREIGRGLALKAGREVGPEEVEVELDPISLMDKDDTDAYNRALEDLARGQGTGPVLDLDLDFAFGCDVHGRHR